MYAVYVRKWLTASLSQVDLLIKKITHAPDTAAPQPYIEAAKTFMMSANPLHVEARLDKEVSLIQDSMQLSC